MQVDDAGDGVGAVLCGGAVAQHLDTLKSRGRNGAEIRAAGAVADDPVEHAQPGHVVAPLAVDEYQRLVGAQAPQRGRPQQCAVTDGLAGIVERRRQFRQRGAEIGLAGALDVDALEHVHAHGQLAGQGLHPSPAAEHDNFLDSPGVRRIDR